MNTQSIVAQLQNKVEECLQGVQQQLDVSYSNISHDQSSFSRIDVFLDQLPLAAYPSIPQNIVNCSPSVASICLPSIQTFTNYVIQEVKPIINLTIHKLIQYNQPQFQSQLTQLQSKQIQQYIKQEDFITNNHHQSNINQYTYNLIQNTSIKQNENCIAIAINKDNSIVLAGCNSQIKVFEFKQEQLKQTQLLSEHSGSIRTLNFMKKQSQFISGDNIGYIIIWSINQNSQWVCQQKLKQHSDCINCLVMNNNEDLIISGSDDYTIIFWVKQNQWVCSQTITDHTNYVSGLSLNDQQNRVISCGRDMFILIIEEQSEKWNVIQKISVEAEGRRLCFINDNVFTFQPYCKEQMHVYEINSTNKQYSKTKEIVVKSGSSCCYHFPQQYINQKCVLVNKNGYNVNLIRKNQNGDFITQQSIDFGNSHIFGQMSEDGEYLITWDRNSYEIQIRKYHEE